MEEVELVTSRSAQLKTLQKLLEELETLQESEPIFKPEVVLLPEKSSWFCLQVWCQKLVPIFASISNLLFHILSFVFYPFYKMFFYCIQFVNILDCPCVKCCYNCYRDHWPCFFCSCVHMIHDSDNYHFRDIHTSYTESTKLSTCTIWPIPTKINQFNFSYLIIDHETETTAVVDPGNPQQVYDIIKIFGLNLSHILITHGHHDHALGIQPLLQKFPEAKVFGSEMDNIPCLTNNIIEGSVIILGSTQIKVFEVPYHTMGHVLFTINEFEAAFTGDSLFGGTIGNPFEAQDEILPTLEKIKRILPPTCLLFVGHDVLDFSIRFSAWLDERNKNILSRLHNADRDRAIRKTTMPYTMDIELKTNPFLRLSEDNFIQIMVKKSKQSEIPANKEEALKLLRKLRKMYFRRDKKVCQLKYDWRGKNMIFDKRRIQVDSFEPQTQI